MTIHDYICAYICLLEGWIRYTSKGAQSGCNLIGGSEEEMHKLENFLHASVRIQELRYCMLLTATVLAGGHVETYTNKR